MNKFVETRFLPKVKDTILQLFRSHFKIVDKTKTTQTPKVLQSENLHHNVEIQWNNHFPQGC